MSARIPDDQSSIFRSIVIGFEPILPAKRGVLPITLYYAYPLPWFGGDIGNRTLHSLLAKQSRPLGTCAPKTVIFSSAVLRVSEPLKLIKWSVWWDLNPRPLVSKTSTLPN